MRTENQLDSRLDITARESRPLDDTGQTRCFAGNPLKDVNHETIHSSHGFAGNARVRVNLLQFFVNVSLETFRLLLAIALLLSSGRMFESDKIHNLWPIFNSFCIIESLKFIFENIKIQLEEKTRIRRDLLFFIFFSYVPNAIPIIKFT